MIIVILVILTLMLLGNGAQAVAPWRYGYSALGVITLVILFLLLLHIIPATAMAFPWMGHGAVLR